MNYTLIFNDDLTIYGFFQDLPINLNKKYIVIDNNLYTYLVDSLGSLKLKKDINLLTKKIYTIKDKNIFEYKNNMEYEDPKPTRIDLLEDQNAKLILEQAHNSIRLNKLEVILKPYTLDLKSSGSTNNWYEDIKIYYDKNNYNIEEMKLFVISNMITKDQYKTITGLDY